MKKILISLSLLLLISETQAAAINFLCPDGTIMHQGTSCAPDAGCHPTGLYLQVNGAKFPADLDNNGAIIIDDAFLSKKVKVTSGDNFWSPSYCKNIRGSGYLTNTFLLKKTQTITMKFHSY